MIDVMNWNECEKRFIRKISVDRERIKSITNKVEKRLKRIRNTEINVETVELVVEDYYEIIKELLVAYLLKNGLRSGNHQCLISYFYKQNPDYEKETQLILQMSFFRNRLNYYGEDIPMEFYQNNKQEFKNITKILRNLLEK